MTIYILLSCYLIYGNYHVLLLTLRDTTARLETPGDNFCTLIIYHTIFSLYGINGFHYQIPIYTFLSVFGK